MRVTPIALATRLPRGYPARWRWRTLFEAPHRLAFAAAVLLLAASAQWWAALQLAREAGIAVHSALPPSIVHGLVMGLGFMPLFFTGFMFTAGPRWLAVAPVAAARLLPAITAQLAGWGVFMLAAHGRDVAFGETLGALSLAAVACGWFMNWLAFRRLLRVSTVADKLHARILLAASLVGL
ncbi:MAG TPA: NnrS family protein, partial [Methylibium sp.]